ncbi:MAG: AI-2E family transporter, partial [Actinomycetota bacterium]
AGLVVLGYVLIYQQVENYWLSPKISSKSMSINGAVAFGAAIAGGALAGPMGAFVALPVAALVIAFMANFTKSYEVVYDAAFDGELLNADEGQAEATADDAGTSDAD